MSKSEEPKLSFSLDQREFATTRWSVVLAAGRERSAESSTALATLCEIYWYPLYSYVRRQGRDWSEAQDLTQGFFVRLLETDFLQQTQPARGKFRSFLLASLKHYMMNEWDRGRAAKRGGDLKLLRLDFEAGERRYRLEPADRETADSAFQKQWALALLARVQEALHSEYRAAGKESHFNRLSVYLTGETKSAPYRQLAIELGTTEGAIKVAVHRLRRRFRDRLREEIAHTVANDADIDDEILALFDAFKT